MIIKYVFNKRLKHKEVIYIEKHEMETKNNNIEGIPEGSNKAQIEVVNKLKEKFKNGNITNVRFARDNRHPNQLILVGIRHIRKPILGRRGILNNQVIDVKFVERPIWGHIGANGDYVIYFNHLNEPIPEEFTKILSGDENSN